MIKIYDDKHRTTNSIYVKLKHNNMLQYFSNPQIYNDLPETNIYFLDIITTIMYTDPNDERFKNILSFLTKLEVSYEIIKDIMHYFINNNNTYKQLLEAYLKNKDINVHHAQLLIFYHTSYNRLLYKINEEEIPAFDKFIGNFFSNEIILEALYSFVPYEDYDSLQFLIEHYKKKVVEYTKNTHGIILLEHIRSLGLQNDVLDPLCIAGEVLEHMNIETSAENKNLLQKIDIEFLEYIYSEEFIKFLKFMSNEHNITKYISSIDIRYGLTCCYESPIKSFNNNTVFIIGQGINHFRIYEKFENTLNSLKKVFKNKNIPTQKLLRNICIFMRHATPCMKLTFTTEGNIAIPVAHDITEIIDLFVEYGYKFTFDDVIFLLENKFFVNNIYKYDFIFDDNKFLEAVKDVKFNPYKTGIKLIRVPN